MSHHKSSSTVKKILPSGPPPQQTIMPAMAGPPPVQRAVLRVNRACTSCRKHKMRCEGADDPPCARCKTTGTQCVFESIKKEQTLDSVAVERLSSLETQFTAMQGTMQEILSTIRASAAATPYGFSPNPPSAASTGTHDPNYFLPHSSSENNPMIGGHAFPSAGSPGVLGPMISPVYSTTPPSAISPNNNPFGTDSSSPTLSSQHRRNTSFGSTNGNRPSPPAGYAHSNMNQPTFAMDTNDVKPPSPHRATVNGIGTYQSIPTSAATSDDEGELPPKALLAPIEVLSDLATVAAEKAGVGSPEDGDTPPGNPGKKRKLNDGRQGPSRFEPGFDQLRRLDVVEKGIISEEEARDLYRIYFTPSGCYRFLAVFNPEVDTFDDLRRRSPFVLCAILMVAARVRDGGSAPSKVHLLLFQEASNLARDTLFSQPQGVECIQAMLLLAGWSSKTGWLAAGHAIRMGMELGMHKALPRLAAKLKSHRADMSTDPRTSMDAALVMSARTWLGLFVFELQIGRGTGRPAMIRGDKSITDGRTLLEHPLSIPTDARLVSTCELLNIQTQIHDQLDEESDYEKVINILRVGALTIDRWHTEWDLLMSNHAHQVAGFFRSSAQIQRMYAILFMHSIALGSLRTAQDVKNYPQMREVLMTAVENARGCLDICINAPEYREGLRYAVTYTQTSAAFAAAFLLRFARLFPRDVNPDSSIRMAESLIRIFSEIPAARYVPFLQQMVEVTRHRWEEMKAAEPTLAVDHDMQQMAHGIPPTPPSQYTNDFNAIINPPSFDPSMSMFPMDSSSGTMEWAAAVNMLDGFGLPASGMSTNGGSLGWLPNSILGDLAVPPSAHTESDGVRDWGMQFAFDI